MHCETQIEKEMSTFFLSLPLPLP